MSYKCCRATPLLESNHPNGGVWLSRQSNWKDCSVEDREQMRTELTKFLERLRPDIEASTIDDFTKADLVERAWSLHHDAVTLQLACAIMSA
jgi:hypothetical protein